MGTSDKLFRYMKCLDGEKDVVFLGVNP